MPFTYTPIRYPGGKSKIYSTIDAIIEANDLIGSSYAEAFCGGAGLAMQLLLKQRVSKVFLNDIDPAVYSMWKMIVHHSDELCSFVANVELSIDEWRQQKETLSLSKAPSIKMGKAAFYLNRTNRSGILEAGPIGGQKQDGNYSIGARFNRKNLCNKIQAIAEYADNISIANMDAENFIEQVLKQQDSSLFANFDPPYVEKGPGLYKNSFDNECHDSLAKRIASCDFPWIVTYDAVPLVDNAYSAFSRYDLSVGYSAASTKIGNEILVAGPGVIIPDGLLERRAA